MLRALAVSIALPSLASAAPLVVDNGEDVANLAAFCKKPDARSICTIADDAKIADLAKPAAPYLAARLFWTGDSETTPNNDCYIGMQTKHGWSVAPIGTDCWGNGKYYRRLVVEELVVRAGAVLWLRYAVESSDPDASETARDEFLVICGGAQPRCTAPIALGFANDGKWAWRVKATLAKGGALTLALAKGKRAALPRETAALLGASTLAFECGSRDYFRRRADGRPASRPSSARRLRRDVRTRRAPLPNANTQPAPGIRRTDDWSRINAAAITRRSAPPPIESQPSVRRCRW